MSHLGKGDILLFGWLGLGCGLGSWLGLSSILLLVSEFCLGDDL